VIIFDASYLVALLHPKPEPPKDREGKPVSQFLERIAYLTEIMAASSDIIGVPTPAMAEVLVRAGNARSDYMRVLSDSWRFQILPFDSRAAIEAAELVAAVKSKSEKWGTWAKVKFDIQIVSIAKAEAASVIYSDDKDLENYAKRFKIRVIRICDLPLPPSKKETPIDSGPIGSQALLPLTDAAAPVTAEALQSLPRVMPDGAIAVTPEGSGQDNELETDPLDSASIRGTDGGSVEGETTGQANTETK
jgi:hypothetical protein